MAMRKLSDFPGNQTVCYSLSRLENHAHLIKEFIRILVDFSSNNIFNENTAPKISDG